MNKKNYLVKMVAYCSVLVMQAESEAEAMELAEEHISQGDLNVDEVSVSHEVKPEDVDAERRHADSVVEED